jgi:O-antigen/teichoic acid export membrane protein
VIDSVILAAAGFLFAAGPGLVQLLYDPRYSQAGWMLQLLSFKLILTRYGIFQNAYLAMGRPQYVTAINIVKLGSMFILVPACYYFYGVSGAILGLALHMVPCSVFIFFINRRLRLNTLRFEFIILCAWAVGWLVGFLSLGSIGAIRSIVTHSV